MGSKGRFLSKSIDLGSAALVPIIAIGAEVLFQIVVLALSLSEVATSWVVVVGNQAVFFLTCFFFTRIKDIDLVELIGVKRVPKWYFFPLFALAAVLCVFTFAPLAGLFPDLLRLIGYTYTPTYYVPFDQVGLFVLAVLGLSVMPAIGEETLMRGVLLSGAKRKSPVFAIFFTALVFALFHGNLTQLIHQFLLGAVMAYLVLLTRSIWASAVVHAVNNTLALLLEYFYVRGTVGGEVYGYFTANFSMGLSVGAFIGVFFASLIALVAVLFFITYLIKCVRTRAGEMKTGKGLGADLTALLSEPSEEGSSQAQPSSDGMWEKYVRYAPIFLVAVLSVLLIANVLSEVLK